MKKFILSAAMVVALFSTSAQANDRLRVNDVHNFVSQMNGAIMDVNSVRGRNTLETLISSQAVFEDNVNNYGHNTHWVNGTHHYDYYGYRYPYYQNYSTVGYRSANKWEKISLLETRKRTIPGYKGFVEINDMTISPLADSAVVDIDFKEQSMTYAPGYAPYYYHHASLNTHSKCKMQLAKRDNHVFLTRMTCNTNTNLPL
jgi:hypothetical protein